MNLSFLKYAITGISIALSAAFPTHAGENSSADEEVAIGEDIRFCEDCPSFAPVPEAQRDGIRPIKYVAQHELTWRQYFAAVDAEICPVPALFFSTWSDEEKRHRMTEWYRIDWPAAYLSLGEIDCYSEWLSSESGFIVDLPTEDEWEWFASAGDASRKYPWGNEEKPDSAAVKGTEVEAADRWPFGRFETRNLLSGVKVGLFPPNEWGLFDLIGNNVELTKGTISGSEYHTRFPESRVLPRYANSDRVLLKGHGIHFHFWRSGIAGSNWTPIVEGRPQTPVAVRLILIEHPPSSEQHMRLIPGTQIGFAEAIFEPRLGEEHFWFENSGAILCRGSYFPSERLYTDIAAYVLQSEGMRFAFLDEECRTEILRENFSEPEGFSILSEITENDCEFRLLTKDDALKRIQLIGSENQRQLSKCLYRIGLFTMGINGALSIPDKRLFVDRLQSPWVTFDKAAPDVPLVQLALFVCQFKLRQFRDPQDLDEAVSASNCVEKDRPALTE